MRLLIQAGPEGIGSGELARLAKVEATTASAQLLVLANAQLVTSRRQGKRVTYYASYQHLREMLAFLMHDCCGSREEICWGLETSTR
ncbi:MAG: ArsR/SmtB family transcription factor [bacterium]